MKAIGIKALKNDLSLYLRLVREGELIYITDRNEIIAELRQPSVAHVSVVSKFESYIADLDRKGDGKRRKIIEPDDDIFEKKPKWNGASALKALNDSREDRDS